MGQKSINGWKWTCFFRRRYPVGGLLFRRSAQAVTAQHQDRLPELCVRGRLHRHGHLDWKYRNGKKDDPKWHQEFFDHMRERAGLMCDWQRPLQGIFDTVVLLLLMLFVSIIMPLIVWGSYIYPLAYAIDFIFGQTLRASDEACREANPSLVASGRVAERGFPCAMKAGSKAYERIVLFTVLAVLYLFFYLLARKSRAEFRDKFYILSLLCGLLLAFTFIPYYIYYFFNQTPIWAKCLIVLFSIVVWFFFPVLSIKLPLF